MTTKAYAATSGTVLGLVALAHLLRLILGWDLSIGAWDAPAWASAVAFVVAGWLGFAGLRIASR